MVSLVIQGTERGKPSGRKKGKKTGLIIKKKKRPGPVEKERRRGVSLNRACGKKMDVGVEIRLLWKKEETFGRRRRPQKRRPLKLCQGGRGKTERKGHQ